MKTKLLSVSLLIILAGIMSCGGNIPEPGAPEERWVAVPTSHSMDRFDAPWMIIPEFSNINTRNLSYEWDSSDTGVATVKMNTDKSATVTPHTLGTAFITIKCKTLPNISACCELTVTGEPGIEVEPDSIDGWGDGDEGGDDVDINKDLNKISVFEGRNLVAFGNSITVASNSWAYQTFKRLEFGNLYNGAVGGARWYKATLNTTDGQVVTTQDYNDPAFAGCGNTWNWNVAADLQKVVNNCAVVHIQKYLAQRGNRVPDFIILSYGTNDRYDASALGNPQSVLQENDLNKLDLFTIPGALKWCIVTLKTNFPNAKIYVALPLQRKDNDKNEGNRQKCAVIKTVCDGLSIPYFDCFNESGITQANIDRYADDGLHPNVAGQTLHTDYIIRKLKAANNAR